MKISFEKAVTITIILIVLVSSFNLYSQYIGIFNINKPDIEVVESRKSLDLRFYTSTIKPDNLYSTGEFDKARDEYLKLAFSDTTNTEQKAYVTFKLGMSYYYLKDNEKAVNALLKSIEYRSDNAKVYNNLAVIFQKMGKIEKAIEYEKKALDVLPVIEYMYNLAKIYEHDGEYQSAVKQFYAVSKGVYNMTLVDPIKIQNRMYSLMGSKNIEDYSDDKPVVALRLKDPLDVLVIDEGDMDIKDINFNIKVSGSETKSLTCSYNIKENDPYNLIKSVSWEIEKDNKVIYKSKNGSIRVNVEQGRAYSINLNVHYKGNKTKERSTQILITPTGYKTNFKSSEIVRTEDQKTKWYNAAIYEQVFETSFKITTKGYYDRFNVIWRKNLNSKIELMEKDVMDTGGALYIVNESEIPAGIEANLSALLNDKKLKGKTISIKFWARKITSKENMKVIMRVDNKAKVFDDFDLIYRWKQFDMTLHIPEKCKDLTFALTIGQDEEVKMDGFIITVLD